MTTTSVPETFYPHLREVLDDRFAVLPDSAIESGFVDAFGEGITPAEYEEFFSGLGRAFSSAAPVLTSIGQGALSGAATGAAFGNPWTALGGAVLGGVGGGLSHVKGPAGDVGRGIGGVVNMAGALTGRGGAGAAPAAGLAAMVSGKPGTSGGQAGGPTSGGPATTLLQALMSRPETLEALKSLLGGRNATVAIGSSGTAAPASAFGGLLGALSREAEAEADSRDASRPDVVYGYLLDSTGRPVVDPGDADMRAARLLALLALTAPAQNRSDQRDEAADDELTVGWADAFDDGLGDDGVSDEELGETWDDDVERWSLTDGSTGYF